jgi:hypothetical protein
MLYLNILGYTAAEEEQTHIRIAVEPNEDCDTLDMRLHHALQTCAYREEALQRLREQYDLYIMPLQMNNRATFDLWTEELNRGQRITITAGDCYEAQTAATRKLSAVTYLGGDLLADAHEAHEAVHVQTSSGQDGTQDVSDGVPGVPDGVQGRTQKVMPDAALGRTPGDTRDDVQAGMQPSARLVRVETLIAALRAGETSITIGPLLTLTLADRGTVYPVGATVPLDVGGADQVHAHLTLDYRVRAGRWSLPKQVSRLKLCSNLGEELNLAVPSIVTGRVMQFEADLNVAAERRWLRAELWGTTRSGVYVLIAVTNAIYFAAASPNYQDLGGLMR